MEYDVLMKEKVEPWLTECVNSVDFPSLDGINIRGYYALNPEEKASIVMVHGFCEFFGKFHETAYTFYEQGYSVFFVELRGHGYSENHLMMDDRRVFVKDFSEYVGDVKAFTEQIVKKYSSTQKLFLYCHSMGGTVGALYLEEYPEDFTCAVLSSPMLAMNFAGVPDPAVAALGVYAKATENLLKLCPGHHAFDFQYNFVNSNCGSEPRYARQFEMRCADEHYQTYAGTWGWASAGRQAAIRLQKNVNQVSVPVLICQAGKDTAVDNSGQDEFVNNCVWAVKKVFPESKHELYAAEDEVRMEYFRTVLQFFGSFTGR